MTDNLLTRDEALQRMVRGEKCETLVDVGLGIGRPTVWCDFDGTYCKFRIPPEPRREAREWADVHGISWGNRGQSLCFGDPIHVREVLPDEVVVRKMTEAEATREYSKWRDSNTTSLLLEVWLASRRALGLIVEDKP